MCCTDPFDTPLLVQLALRSKLFYSTHSNNKNGFITVESLEHTLHYAEAMSGVLALLFADYLLLRTVTSVIRALFLEASTISVVCSSFRGSCRTILNLPVLRLMTVTKFSPQIDNPVSMLF